MFLSQIWRYLARASSLRTAKLSQLLTLRNSHLNAQDTHLEKPKPGKFHQNLKKFQSILEPALEDISG
jgi:hypothetical protein